MNNQILKLTCNIILLSLVILMMRGISLLQALPQEMPEPSADTNILRPNQDDAKKCAEDFKNCQDLSYYPSDLIDKFFAEGKISKDALAYTDSIKGDEAPRFSDVETGFTFLCKYREEIIHPRAAQKPDGDWTYVVQAPLLDINQGLNVELCLTPYEISDTNCALAHQYGPSQLKSRCIQKYTHKKLLTFNTTSGITNEPIAVPSCCTCMYDKFNE